MYTIFINIFLVDAEYFTGVQAANLLIISLTNDLTAEDVNGKKYFEMNAIATQDGMTTGNAAIIIVIEDDECSTEDIKTITFEDKLYSGSISTAGALTLNTLKLAETVTDVTFAIEQGI